MNNLYQANEEKLKQVNGGRGPGLLSAGRPRFNSTGRSPASSTHSQVSGLSGLRSPTRSEMMQMARPGSASSTGSLSSATRYSTATASSAGGGGGRNRAVGIGAAVVAAAGAATASGFAISDAVDGTHWYGNLINKED